MVRCDVTFRAIFVAGHIHEISNMVEVAFGIVGQSSNVGSGCGRSVYDCGIDIHKFLLGFVMLGVPF